MLERLNPFRRKQPAIPEPPQRELESQALEEILAQPLRKGSFVAVEDHSRVLARGAVWRRRRFGWNDAATGEALGLCVNELRIRRGARVALRPVVAASHSGLMSGEALQNAYWATTWASGALRGGGGGRRESRLFLNTGPLTLAKPGAPRGPWEDLTVLQQKIAVGEAVEDWAELLAYMTPELVSIEGTPLLPARYLPAFQVSDLVQAHSSIIAAVNGGYFLNFPEEYDDGLSSLHQPVGLLHADGRLQMPPWVTRPAAIEWIDGLRHIELVGPESLLFVSGDISCPVRLAAKSTVQHEARVWRRIDGPIITSAQEAQSRQVVDLVFSGVGLARVLPPGQAEAPHGGAILRLSGRIAEPWTKYVWEPRDHAFPPWNLVLKTSRDVPVAWALAAGPKLMVDGYPLQGADLFSFPAAGEFSPKSGAPTRFPYDADKTRGPRTIIGITSHEEWVILQIDGRTEASHSIGLTLEELGRLAQALEFRQALNLDGGGSSAMSVEAAGALDRLRPDVPASIVGLPSDPGHRERIVPVALAVVTQ